MQAIVRDHYGIDLKLEDVDTPAVGDGQVLLRVHGSSVNMGDRLMMKGTPYVMRFGTGLFGPRQHGQGMDVAGTVEAVGPDVTEWNVGDALYGEVTGGAAWAEYAAAPAEKLARAPEGVPLEEVGALPVAAMTALQAVRDHGKVQAGQRVLVNGGSGSVGSYVVQIADALGAEVTAVCSAANADRARKLGAAHVIDYATDDFLQTDEPYDVMIDIAGSRPLGASLKGVKPDGVYVTVGAQMDDPWIRPLARLMWSSIRGMFARQKVVVFVTDVGRESLDALSELIEAGELVPAYDSRCTLAELPDAMRELEAGTRRGKLLITG